MAGGGRGGAGELRACVGGAQQQRARLVPQLSTRPGACLPRAEFLAEGVPGSRRRGAL